MINMISIKTPSQVFLRGVVVGGGSVSMSVCVCVCGGGGMGVGGIKVYFYLPVCCQQQPSVAV